MRGFADIHAIAPVVVSAHSADRGADIVAVHAIEVAVAGRTTGNAGAFAVVGGDQAAPHRIREDGAVRLRMDEYIDAAPWRGQACTVSLRGRPGDVHSDDVVQDQIPMRAGGRGLNTNTVLLEALHDETTDFIDWTSNPESVINLLCLPLVACSPTNPFPSHETRHEYFL